MADSEKPVPPVPNQQELVEKLTGSTKVSIPWMQWFVQLREKVNLLNESIINLIDVTGTGIIAKSGASWFARTITGTADRISVTNGDGAAGDPIVDLIGTGVTPGAYTSANITVDEFGRITSISSGSGGGSMVLAGSAVVSGAATSTLTVSGLDLNTDSRYAIWMNLGNATGSATIISLFYNADTTQTNYYVQFWNVTGTSVTGAARGNNASLFSVNASSSILCTAELAPDITSGFPRLISKSNRNAPSAVETVLSNHIRNNVANVTSVTISASIANSLAIGSYIRIYKIS